MAQQSFEYKEKYGHFPLWSESAFGGMPAYTIALESKSNFGMGYLRYLLTWGLPDPISFFFLACVCFYILMLVLRVNPWIGMLASLAYAYCTYDPVIIATGHVTKMAAIGFAPGLIAGLLLLFRRQYLWGTATLAVFAGLQLQTQHLQVFYYTFLGMAILGIAYVITSLRQGQVKDVLFTGGLTAVAIVLAFGTSLVSTLPVQEYSKETMRGGRTELKSDTSKLESHNGLSKDYAFQWSYGIGETLTLAVPGIYGGSNGGKEIGDNSKFAERLGQEFGAPEETGLQYANGSAYWGAQPFTSGPVYLGAVVCLLFLFGSVYVRGWLKWALLGITVVGIVLAWGKNFPALNYFLFDHFPFYNKFRAPTLALIMPQLAVPMLAALGLNQLLAGQEGKEVLWKYFKKAAYATGALLVVLIAFYFTASYQAEHDSTLKQQFMQGKMQQLSQGKAPGAEVQAQATATANGLMKALQDDRQGLYGSDLVRALVLMILAGALLALFIKGKIKSLVLVGGLIVLSTYDLLAVGTRYLNQDSYTDPADFEANLAPTPADQQIKSDPDKNFRVLDESAGSPFEDARASYHHNSLGGYSPAKLGLYQDLIEHQLSKGNMQVFDMLNTKYVIQRDPRTGQFQAHLNPGAFGPCWLVKSIHVVKDGNEEMKALDSTNLRDTVVIQQAFASIAGPAPQPDSTASIKLIENLNDKITYKSSAGSNQFAVFSEIYYDKGWNAFLDGNKVPYCRVDYLLRGMPVPAGEHTIEFRFEPHSYALGNTLAVWSSLLVFLLLAGAVFATWRKRA